MIDHGLASISAINSRSWSDMSRNVRRSVHNRNIAEFLLEMQFVQRLLMLAKPLLAG